MFCGNHRSTACARHPRRSLSLFNALQSPVTQPCLSGTGMSVYSTNLKLSLICTQSPVQIIYLEVRLHLKPVLASVPLHVCIRMRNAHACAMHIFRTCFPHPRTCDLGAMGNDLADQLLLGFTPSPFPMSLSGHYMCHTGACLMCFFCPMVLEPSTWRTHYHWPRTSSRGRPELVDCL